MGSLVNSAQSSFSLLTQFTIPDPLLLITDSDVLEFELDKIGNLRYTTCIQMNSVMSVTIAMERRTRVVDRYPIVLVETDTKSYNQ